MELHIEERVNVVNDSIENYKVQFAMTKKAVFELLISKRRKQLKLLESEQDKIYNKKKRHSDTHSIKNVIDLFAPCAKDYILFLCGGLCRSWSITEA